MFDKAVTERDLSYEMLIELLAWVAQSRRIVEFQRLAMFLSFRISAIESTDGHCLGTNLHLLSNGESPMKHTRMTLWQVITAHVGIRIDTQDVLLGAQNVQRLIEIGPSNTLAALAKRTVNSTYRAHDAQSAVKRQLLSCKLDQDEIYYDQVAQVDDDTTSAPKQINKVNIAGDASKENLKSGAGNAGPDSVGETSAPQPTAEQAITVPIAVSQALVEDAPVSALEIILSLVAAKLGKKPSEVTESNTPKNLCGGN